MHVTVILFAHVLVKTQICNKPMQCIWMLIIRQCMKVSHSLAQYFIPYEVVLDSWSSKIVASERTSSQLQSASLYMYMYM